MSRGKGRYHFLFFLFLMNSTRPVFAQNFVFAQLTGAPMNTAGWNLQGEAHVTTILGPTNSEILLCSGFNSSGAVFYNQPINLSFCSKWIAEFDFRMYDGTGADGIAFCFLDVPPVGFVNGGGLGIPSTANGLKVCFDTWNNCIPFDPNYVHNDMPKIEIRYGIGYDKNDGQSNLIVGECLSEPTRDNYDGKLSYIRSPDYNHAKIVYNHDTIQVYVNDTLYLTGIQAFNFTGYLGFTASTGGYSDNHSIKNAIIYTEMPPSYAGADNGLCPADTLKLGGPPNSAYTYTWSPAGNLNDTSVSAPLLHIKNDSPAVQYLTYFVTTAFKTNPGCYSRDSVTIQVYSPPNVHFTTPEICLTDAIAQFYDSTFTSDSTMLPFSYKWSFGDPNAGPSNPDSSVLKDPSHIYSAASYYPLTLAVTNSKGCIASKTKTFTVNGAVPVAALNVDQPSALCSNRLVNISNESSVDFGSITRLQIDWGDSAGKIETDEIPYPGKIYAHQYPNPVTTNSAGYTIRMVSYSGISCLNETEQQINVLPAPHVLFNPLPSFCDYDSAVQLTEASESTHLPGSFSFSGAGITPEGLFIPGMAGAGKFPLLCTYTNGNGCTDSAYQTVTVIAPPVTNAGNDTSIVVNQPLQLQAVSDPADEISYWWSPATGLTDPGIANPIAHLSPDMDKMLYTVRATDTSGCFGLASVQVKIFKTEPSIFVPNAFTPGGLSNNIFRPIPVGISSLSYFRVYDRWGRLMYSTSRLGDGWDGNASGKPQDSGGYVWMVRGTTYTGETITKRGTMVLLR
jgi:gliding motility-associated-like protein